MNLGSLNNINRVLNINQIEMENMRLHQGNHLNATLEAIPDFVTASSPKPFDCCVQIALRHHMRNHRSDIGTSAHVQIVVDYHLTFSCFRY